MSYPITDLDGISPDIAKLLKSEKIRTTERLLDAAGPARARQRLASKTGLSPKDILRWVNMADRMRIKGIGEDRALLLEAVGCVTVRELGYRSPAKLAKTMRETNAKRKLVRNLPNERAIARWIAEARKLTSKITY